MGYLLLFLFIAIPLIEIAVFIEVGGWIGLLPTIALILLTAMAGIALLRRQGLATLNRARAALDRGEMPVAEVFDGFCLLLAGGLLLTPGFVTDIAGLLLFLPPVRAGLRRFLGSRFAGQTGFVVHGYRSDGSTIDGEYEEIREPGKPLPGWGKRDDGEGR